MDELFTLHPHRLFLRGEAIEHGYDDRDLARACQTGRLVRIRQGTYIDAQQWPDDTSSRHLLRARGVTLRHDRRVALSHTTGALTHGLRLWEPDLGQVHVTRLDGNNGRAESDVAYHRDAWDAETLVQLDDMLVIDPIRCALGAAMLTSVEAGLVVLDSVLDHGLASTSAIADRYAEMSRSPFTRPLQVAVRLARQGSQSVGETRTRYMFWQHHLPEPVLQYEVHDGDRLVGICDFAWPEYGLLGEFDGKIKYRHLVPPGQTPSDVVFREKRREDQLREITGWPMIRFIYADLYAPARAIERTRRMLMRAST